MTEPRWDVLLIDGQLATLANDDGYGLIESAAIAWKDGIIAFVGKCDDLPGEPDRLAARGAVARRRTGHARAVDCHTHLVFGGDRAGEFEQRLNGASYEDIARAGGGIMSTVRATARAERGRAAHAIALPRARALLRRRRDHDGDQIRLRPRPRHRAKMLRSRDGSAASSASRAHHPAWPRMRLPPEFKDRRTTTSTLRLRRPMLPALPRTAWPTRWMRSARGSAFTPRRDAPRVRARDASSACRVKLHADQLSDLGGAALVAEFGALVGRPSRTPQRRRRPGDGCGRHRRGAAAGRVLCAARNAAAADRCSARSIGVPIAIATDCNPGTSPAAVAAARDEHGLHPVPADARGSAARASPCTPRARSAWPTAARSRIGKRADLVVWNAREPAELCYWIGGSLARAVYAAGRELAART